MTTITRNKPSIGFWIAAILGLMWNLLGVNAYLQQAYKTESFRANFNAEQLAIMDNCPAWATAAFAIAVFAGALGCLALILRKKIAKILFVISLIGVVVQFSYELFKTKASEFFGAFDWIMTIMIPVVCIYLIWVAKKAIAKGWIS